MYDDDDSDEKQSERSREQRVAAAWPGPALPGFGDWLCEQTGRADPVGDLADDMRGDRRWPARGGVVDYIDHLTRQRACAEAIEALLDAFAEFHGLSL